MARETPPDRFAELVRCAAEVFIAQGYRRTQMADVAAALGVAKGTLYLYVESKEALFDLVARHADAPPPIANPPALPVRTPKPGQTRHFVRERLVANRAPDALLKALRRRAPVDPRAELKTILEQLYDLLVANRVGIKLLDASSRDHPDLAAVWFEGARGGLVALLEQYIARRARQKRLAPVPDTSVAARIVLETLVFWAVHRHWDPSPQPVDEKTARATAIDLMVRALAQE